jgi:hypothetical protein
VANLFSLPLERSLFGGTVELVLAQHPPAKAHHAQGGDEKGSAQPQPRGHPFAGEKDHAFNYRQSAARSFQVDGLDGVLQG